MGLQSSTRGLQGTSGAPALLTISDAATYNFGTQSIGSTTEHTFTISNGGAVEALAMVDTGGALASPYQYKGSAYPGTGGDCGATLASSASCIIVVLFEPTGAGTFTDTISIDYNDGSTGQTTLRDITGDAAPPALLTITESDPYDFSSVTVGASSSHVFTIDNTGGVSATAISEVGLSLPYRFTGGAFPGTLGTCSTTLSAGSNCDLDIEFAPTASGVQLDTIEIDYFNGTSTLTVSRNLTGAGLDPALISISDGPGNFDFGTVPTGSSNVKTFTLSNGGASQATVLVGGGLSAPFSYEGGAYPGTTGTCTTSLNAGANCQIVVVYSPIAVSAGDTNTINISYNDGVNSTAATRGVDGLAVAPASIDISESDPFNFGTLATGATTVHTFVLTNSGGFQATAVSEIGIGAPFLYFGGSFPGTGGDCTSSLAASATCEIVIQYGPSTNVVHNDFIDVSYNDGVNVQNSLRAITGTGVLPADLTISETNPYDYGTIAIGSTSTFAFTVSNSGEHQASAMNETGLALPFRYAGTGIYPGTGGTCGSTLNPSASCTLFIEFAPTGTGVANDEISLSYANGAVTQIATRQLQGTGSSAANITISEAPSYAYPDTTVGTARLHTFNLTNTGGVTATTVAGGGLGSPFTYEGGSFPGATGTCTTSIAVGATCDVVVEFAPTSSGLASGSIDITYFDGASGASSNRVVTGTGLNPAILTISEVNPYDYGVVANGGQQSHVFTITNSGGSAASVIVESGIVAPFNYLGGGYPGTGGDCGTTLGASATCTIVVEFSPISLGSFAGVIDFSYNDGDVVQTVQRNIQGTSGVPATLVISESDPYSYGTQAVGSNTDFTFTITNSGAVDATSMADAAGLSAPFSFNGGAYPGVGGDCTTSLATGASCDIVVRYQPTAPGLITDTIDINYDTGVSVVNTTRDVEGTGATPANISISESEPYDYGTYPIGSVTPHTFTLNNSGQITATGITEITLAPPFNFRGGTFPGTLGTCGTTLSGAGTTCTIVVEYSPTATGLQSSDITISYFNGAITTNAVRGVQATGVSLANLTISEIDPFNYGTVPTGSSNLKTFIITNTGGFQATAVSGLGVSAPFSFLGGSYPGGGGNCGVSINAGANCNIVVEYAPTVVSPSDTSTVQIDYNDGLTTQSSTRAVAGAAVAPALLNISESDPYSFGLLATGSISTNTFTVTNDGGFNATAMSETGVALPFRYAGGGGFPGVGGDCTTSLAPTNSCDIVIEYAPSIPATDANTINFNYNDGVNSQSSTRDMAGTAVNPASLSISESDPFDMGTISLGSSSTQIFTVTNSGGFTASGLTEVGLGAPFSFTGGSYPGATGDCTGSLPAAGTCTIEVEFTASGTGLFSDTIQMSYNDGANPQIAERDIQGTGATPAVMTISETDPYDFGSVTQGATATKIFNVTNTGGVTASGISGAGLVAPFTYLGSAYPGSGGTCGSSLSPSITCTIVVEFAPTSLGILTGTIQINYSDGTTTQTSERDVAGTGIAPAILTVSDGPTYDYGLIAAGGIKTKSLTVTNGGDSIASGLTEVGLASPFEFFGGSYPGTGGDCAASLAPTASCTLVVAYRPTVAGVDASSMDLDYFDGAALQTVSRAIQGTAGAPASIAISGVNPYSYGTVATGGTVTNTFTLTNSGGVSAEGLADSGLMVLPYEFKGGAYPGVGGDCTTSLGSTSSCNVVVDFKPTIIGFQSDQIEINYDNGVIITSVVHDVEGTGATPGVITISETDPYNFGTLATGADTTHAFTITNTGGVAVTALSELGLSAPFTLPGGFPGAGGTCTTSLNAGASCQIVVEFAPSTTGLQTRVITMSYFDGSLTQNSTRDIVGTGAAPALLTVSESDPYSFGSVTSGSSSSHTFIITNTGGVPATAISGAGLVAPFNWVGGTFPGAGGDCTATLAVSGTCEVEVEYAPPVAATDTGTFTINYNDGSAGASSARDVAGTGITPAVLTLSDGPSYDYGSVVLGNFSDKVFTVTKSGATNATTILEVGLSGPFDFAGGTYPGSGGTCGAVISVDCTIVIRFEPTIASIETETIELTYYNGANVQSANRDVSATGVSPAALSISDGPTYDFGTVPTGGTGEWTFTIDNTGGATATSLSEIGLDPPYNLKGGVFPGTGGTCSATLNASSNCTIVVEFSPTTTGTQIDVIDISYNNGTATVSAQRNVTGSSGTPALLVLSNPPQYDFGTLAVGTSAVHAITVTNTGGIEATAMSGAGLASPFGFTGGAYPGATGNCGLSLAPSASCTIEIIYNPGTATSHADALDVFYNDGLTGVSSSRALIGEAVNPALLIISDGPIFDFDLVLTGNTVSKVFNVTNSGGADATLMSGISLSAPYRYEGGSYPGATGNCGTSLASGSSCTVVVEYTPFATGVDTEILSVQYFNSASTVTSDRDLTGNGYFPLPTLTLFAPATSPNNDTTPTVRISDVVDGLLVNLYADATCSTGIQNAGAATSPVIDLTSAPLVDGAYNFRVVVQDSYGNLSGCSASNVNYDLDATDPSPSSWPWAFINGVTDGGFSNNFNPHIQVTGIASENGTTIQLYENNTCVLAKGSLRTVASGEATVLDVSYASDGSQDGLKEFYAIATDTVGNVSACETITLDYTLDTQIFAPALTGGILCNEVSGPNPTLSVTCEPNAIVSIGLGGSATAVLNPDPTTQSCGLTGTASIPLNFTTDGLASIEITQDDAAGNASSITSCISTIQTNATITSTTPPGNEIVFDNKTSFPISGTCSHVGTGNVRVTGVFAGSPAVLNCDPGGTWNTNIDFSPLPDDDLSVETLNLTHFPGSGAIDGSVSADFNNCRAVASFQIYSRINNMEYETSGTADQIPIWNFGDGSPEVQQATNMSYTYSSPSYPYTVQVKHCPREITRLSYTRSGTTNNAIRADFSTFMPAPTDQYTSLTYMYFNNNSNTADFYGLAGDAPDPDDMAVINEYSLFYHSNITSMPTDINCPGKTLRRWRFYYPTGGTNALTHPIVGADCYDSITYYDQFSSGGNGSNYTGIAMDIGNFINNITYYRVYRLGLTVPVPAAITTPSLTSYQVYQIEARGGVATGTVVPDLSAASALSYFDLRDNGFTGSLPSNHADNWPAGLRTFYLGSDPISGTIADTFLINAPLALQNFQITGTVISGDMPTLSHLPAIVNYYVHSNLLDINTYPDPSGRSLLQNYYIHNNPVTNPTGPYPLPDWTTLPALVRYYATGVDFTGASMGLSDLGTTNMHDLRVQNGNNINFTDFNYPAAGPSDHFRYAFIENNNYVGGLGAPVEPGIPTYRAFQYLRTRNMGMSQAECDELFDYVYANRAAIDAAVFSVEPRYEIFSGQCTFSTDQTDKINGTGPHVGEGLLPDYDIRFGN